MTNSSYLSQSVEAARLRSVTELQDYLFNLSEKQEREEQLETAESYAPKMIFHRLANVGWIIVVDLDCYYRPCDQNTFARLSEPLMKDAGLPFQLINNYTIFIRTHEPEEKIREEIALACLPF